MSHFDNAILNVLRHEGGYCDNPSDPGGETNFGICKRTYPKLDIKNLTTQDAISIYRRDFWNYHYDEMPYRVAAKVFDMAVNMGAGQAHKLLQRAVGAKDDGIIGLQTLKAISKMDVETILNNITNEQKRFYNRIIQRKPTSSVFLAGWLHRAEWQPRDVA